jgi:hypothetical protein
MEELIDHGYAVTIIAGLSWGFLDIVVAGAKIVRGSNQYQLWKVTYVILYS